MQYLCQMKVSNKGFYLAMDTVKLIQRIAFAWSLLALRATHNAMIPLEANLNLQLRNQCTECDLLAKEADWLIFRRRSLSILIRS
jgi:hypothetical protein